MADNKDKKVLKSSIEREQNQTCLNSAEREKIKGSTNLNVPHLRFPEFSGEWEKCKLEDCVDFLDGLRKPIKSEDRKCEMGLYPYYGASGIIDYIDEYIFDGDYILLSEDGANILDRNYRVAFLAKGKIWVNNHAHVLLPHTNIDIDFLSEALERLNYAVYNTGTTMPKLNQEVCRTIGLYIPPIKEQNKIGALLSLLNERIATQNKIIEDLKLLRDAIIERAYRNRSNHPCRIGDVIEQISERNKDKSIDMVLSVSNKQGFINQSEQFEDRIIASEDTSNYKIVYKNDFAYNPARINVGSIARLRTIDMGIVSPMYICFRVRKEVVSEYLEYFFSTSYFFYEMQKRLEGSVRQCLSFEGICNIPIYIPSSEEQHTISKKISVLLDKIDVESCYHCKLEEQKQYLLRQMFI